MPRAWWEYLPSARVDDLSSIRDAVERLLKWIRTSLSQGSRSSPQHQRRFDQQIDEAIPGLWVVRIQIPDGFRPSFGTPN